MLERGKQQAYLLTNVFDAKRLTEDAAGVLYEMRWGVEVFFRSYKQTLHRCRLLSRTPATCLAECQWTMLGLWLLGLMTVGRLLVAGVDPLWWSVAAARNTVRRAMRTTIFKRRACRLQQLLRRSIKDTYQRRGPKDARDYPRKKREKPPNAPQIQSASPKQVQRAKRLQAKIRLAA